MQSFEFFTIVENKLIYVKFTNIYIQFVYSNLLYSKMILCAFNVFLVIVGLQYLRWNDVKSKKMTYTWFLFFHIYFLTNGV